MTHRIYALSDLHVDYPQNREWVQQLSRVDYQADDLIVAGDLTHKDDLLLETLDRLQASFAQVVFIPGNHDLWVPRQGEETSWDKLHRLRDRLATQGIVQHSVTRNGISIVPLLSWYDFSFGEPDARLRQAWMDFHRCRWPDNWRQTTIAREFAALNPAPDAHLPSTSDHIVTCSHFMPRPDLLPDLAVKHFGFLLPVLGTTTLDNELRRHQSHVHLYGHSHVHVDKIVNGIRYVNNARGYPSERSHARHRLRAIV